jgi:hypothetical protein
MNELAKIEPQDSRMIEMIERMATDPLVDPAKLREILAVKQSWEADEARKAFSRAMSDFQNRCPIISKADTANGRGYARIDRLHRETRKLREECGFWFVWTVCEVTGELVHLEGILGHSGNHQMPIKQTIPLPDKISGTNAAQRAGSAQTYAKRYGELAALNIVTGEDDDGNAKPKAIVPAPQSSAAAALKKQLWDITQPIHRGDKNALRQFLVDDCGLEPEKPMEDLTAKELETLLFVAKKKV